MKQELEDLLAAIGRAEILTHGLCRGTDKWVGEIPIPTHAGLDSTRERAIEQIYAREQSCLDRLIEARAHIRELISERQKLIEEMKLHENTT